MLLHRHDAVMLLAVGKHHVVATHQTTVLGKKKSASQRRLKLGLLLIIVGIALRILLDDIEIAFLG